MSPIARMFIALGIQVDDKELKEVFKSVNQLRSAFAHLGRFVTSAAGRLVGFVESTAEAGNKTLSLAASLGISTTAVQQLGYVAKQNGSNMNELAVGVRMFERTLRSIHDGGGSKLAKKALHDFGLTTKDVNAALTSDDGLMGAFAKLSDGFVKFHGDAQGAAALQSLMGARARGVAADLSKGGNAFRAQIAEAQKLGLVRTEAELRALQATDRNFKKLGSQWDALKQKIVADLAPKLIAALDRISDWVASHGPEITKAVDGVCGAFMAIGRAIAWLINSFAAAEDGSPLDVALWTAIGAVVGGVVLSSFLSLLAPLGKVLGFLGKIAVVIFEDAAPALGGLVESLVGVEAASGAVAASLALWLAPIIAAAAALFGIYELGQTIKEEFDTSHEEKLEGEMDRSRQYAQSNPKDPYWKSYARSGTKRQQDDFDKNVHGLDWEPSKAASATAMQGMGPSNTTNTTSNSTAKSTVINDHSSHVYNIRTTDPRKAADEIDARNRHARAALAPRA